MLGFVCSLALGGLCVMYTVVACCLVVFWSFCYLRGFGWFDVFWYFCCFVNFVFIYSLVGFCCSSVLTLRFYFVWFDGFTIFWVFGFCFYFMLVGFGFWCLLSYLWGVFCVCLFCLALVDCVGGCLLVGMGWICGWLFGLWLCNFGFTIGCVVRCDFVWVFGVVRRKLYVLVVLVWVWVCCLYVVVIKLAYLVFCFLVSCRGAFANWFLFGLMVYLLLCLIVVFCVCEFVF